MWAPMMGLCPSPAGREPLSLFERFSALVYFTSTRVNEALLFSDSLSEPTTVLSEHVAPSSDDELAWRLFYFYSSSLVMLRGSRRGSRRGHSRLVFTTS
ncbi:hypothetical protein EVAR_34177_1 [Eumeta japonica]|uniref:Uncharacterized protein n=1 Tax=Eumeta variegata TaxID=151549 RepID=A0A4C1WK25_EUMVA|nr:hypothetical protein EVAR_34177_1 [Eumeta japonica]